jgi:hypothetical protein
MLNTINTQDPDSGLAAEHWQALLSGDTTGVWHERFLARAATHPAFLLDQCLPGDMHEWVRIWTSFDSTKVKTTTKKEPSFQWLLNLRDPLVVPKAMVPRMVHAVTHNDQRSLRMQMANIMMNAEKFQSIPPWVIHQIGRMYCSDHSLGAKAPRCLVGLLRALVIAPNAQWTQDVYSLIEPDPAVSLFTQWMAPSTRYDELVERLALIGESFPAAAYDWHLSYDEPVLSELMEHWPDDITARISSQMALGTDERVATIDAWTTRIAVDLPGVHASTMDSAGS